jgi:hypothetical protein
MVYSLVTPIWEGPDEWGHYEYIKYLIDNLSLPGPGDSTSRLGALNQPPLYYILTALVTPWVDTSDDLQPVENPYTYTGITRGGVNRFIHPDTEAFPYQGTVLAVHVARLVSVFVSTLVVAVTYFLGRLLFPDQKAIALGAMAINAFSPGFLFMGSVINNDILVTLFFSLALFFSVKVVIQSPDSRDLLALGGFTGLALLSKYNALALIPLVVASHVSFGRRPCPAGRGSSLWLVAPEEYSRLWLAHYARWLVNSQTFQGPLRSYNKTGLGCAPRWLEILLHFILGRLWLG